MVGRRVSETTFSILDRLWLDCVQHNRARESLGRVAEKSSSARSMMLVVMLIIVFHQRSQPVFPNAPTFDERVCEGRTTRESKKMCWWSDCNYDDFTRNFSS